EIDGERFLVNGQPTYPGRSFKGRPVEGLLFNVRAVQATFDDENWPEVESYDTAVGTRSFAYPDTGRWDADRNVREFCAALPDWRAHGVLAVTLNFQGGRPIQNAWKEAGANLRQPHHDSAFTPAGELKADCAARVARALEALDRAGMTAIVGYFYFGQDYRLRGEAAVLRATDEATDWLLRSGHRNVLVEVANETCPQFFSHDILKPPGVAGLIERVKGIRLDGRRLLVSASFPGGWLPSEEVIAAGDFILPHGNGQAPEDHAALVEKVRATGAFRARPQPIVFNEAGTDVACLDAAFRSGASWGYHDHGANNYRDGFQSPPVNWAINTPAKKAFFGRVAEITGCGERS
ncbi:MAG: hypothetical protein ACYS1C_10625, partial [Planctomycetota bacterium]